MQKNTPQQPHVPVLLSSVLDTLAPKEKESYLDLTAGYGGHAKAIIDITAAPNKTVLIDQDAEAIEALNKMFTDTGIEIRHQDFLSAVEHLLKEGRQFDMILMDLGVSSPQFDIARRGFSLQQDGPLDMRMDKRQSLTAAQLVNTLPAQELAKLLKGYGEEPRSQRIATAIVRARPLDTTLQLASVVQRASGRGWSKIHPATRTFQALRIAVNDELNRLEQTLETAKELLTDNGRLAIISFHSLEDRIVKQFVRENAGDRYDSELVSITKRPIAGTEDVFNPRARSAKLRAVAKIHNQRKESPHANSGKG